VRVAVVLRSAEILPVFFLYFYLFRGGRRGANVVEEAPRAARE